MDDRQQLRAVAENVARNMASTLKCAEPEVGLTSGSNVLPAFAVANDVAHFEIPTLFGFGVRVTVSKIGPLDRMAGF